MKSFVFAATIALGALAAAPGNAMPAYGPAADANIVHVEGGCGPAFHRGPYGRCYPNYVERPVYRACPPGMHLNPYGRCRPNY